MPLKRSPFVGAPLPPRDLDALYHAKKFDPVQEAHQWPERRRQLIATMNNGDLRCMIIAAVLNDFNAPCSGP